MEKSSKKKVDEPKHYNITGEELRKILYTWGYNQREFTDFIGRTRTFFTNYFLNKPGNIPYRYVNKLKEFLGEEDFYLAMKMIEDLHKKENN